MAATGKKSQAERSSFGVFLRLLSEEILSKRQFPQMDDIWLPTIYLKGSFYHGIL
jgi:hypothetical protein